MEYGIWSMEYGVWGMEYGVWSSIVPGLNPLMLYLILFFRKSKLRALKWL